MSDFDPTRLNSAELDQYLAEEQLVSDISLDEAGGFDRTESIATQREEIRRRAMENQEYHAALRKSVAADGLRDMSTIPTDRVVERTKEEQKEVLDRSLPLEAEKFPHLPTPILVERDYDTVGALHEVFRAGLPNSEHTILAAKSDLERIKAERNGRVRGLKMPDPAKARSLEGHHRVAADQELWDAEDKVAMLEGRDDLLRIRAAQAEAAYRSNPNETNLRLKEEAERRLAAFDTNKNARHAAAMDAFRETNEPHRHAQELHDVHAGYVTSSDKARTDIERQYDVAKKKLEEAERAALYDPAAGTALAKAQDKFDRLSAQLEDARHIHREDRQSVKSLTLVMEGLPGLVSREKFERENGSLQKYEDQMVDAITEFLQGTTDEDTREHHLFKATNELHDYIAKIDEKMADMSPTDIHYEQVFTMRRDAMTTLMRATYAAECVRRMNATVYGTFEGRHESRFLTREGEHGLIIERNNGRFAIYPDGSFARLNDDGSRDDRLNPDGTLWRKGQPLAPDTFGNYNNEIDQAERLFSGSKESRERERRSISDDDLIDLDRDVYEAWLLNQDDPEIAEYALKLHQEIRGVLKSEIDHSSDLTYVREVKAILNAIEYESQLIDFMSLNNKKHNNKNDRLYADGRFAHVGTHYGREGRWLTYPDGELQNFTFDEHNNIVTLARYNAAGQRVA